ncbi:uncharacterized protein LOC108038595 [Drosophila rhopaloa]|uniref:Uncharacterized protein n=1 Tax=Drosophila rhopaloa TaxID=1041015 RepID=A0ABM5J3S7_DRORH|nr:uncharacterized protein LOC108038595 [Drosophila rhopaloa]XP_044313473.1 uncharacterized protein LOC108038595 [Drosophila rhopaloa]XP_044313478.1 uncharacterized protein LOC108038595 [Drosophila rhopaloa]
MQYLNYALQTSTRLLTYQGPNQDLYPDHTGLASAHEEDLKHACCSRGAQLLRLRHRELAKRRALEDQINANQEEEPEDQQQEQEDLREELDSDQGAVGGEHLHPQPVQ